jgi:hypothetical protein
MAKIKINLPGSECVIDSVHFDEIVKALSHLKFIDAPYVSSEQKKAYPDRTDFFNQSGKIEFEILPNETTFNNQRWYDYKAQVDSQKEVKEKLPDVDIETESCDAEG